MIIEFNEHARVAPPTRTLFHHPWEVLCYPKHGHRRHCAPFCYDVGPINNWGIRYCIIPLCCNISTGLEWTYALTASLNPLKPCGIDSTVLLLCRVNRCSPCKTTCLAHNARTLCQANPQSVLFALLHKDEFMAESLLAMT